MSLKETIKQVLPAPAWAMLKQVRSAYTRRTFPTREVHHLYGGCKLKVHIGDPLAEGWYDRDWVEPEEITELRRGRLRRGARVFDLGAHQSVVALMLAHCVGPDGSVLAVEATPYDVEVSRRNKALNGFNNVEILHAAVAAKSGHIDFTLDGCVSSNHVKAPSIRLPAYSIDDLSGRYGTPDVLFIDIEGYECEALRGAGLTMATSPDCFVEVHVGVGLERFGGSVGEILSYFPPERYDVIGFPAKGGPIEPLHRDSPVLREHFNLVALSRR